MDKPRTSAAPIIVALLLLLPVLYLGSYLTPVVPGAAMPYRGIEAARIFFWPLEQIDRRVRPQSWAGEFDQRLPPKSVRFELYDPFRAGRVH